ncbi:Vms1/Ankzf1 family peptidyl-tRNA hydrolase [Kineococcus glutinatus]|uniref:Vms1/Ankzf1 family peptidyl-tRNA hydrolase n=1 Tax=Kineococcus glutinatus TaxID=1070872 RepID=A0ABP9HQS2_9ACTN
MKLDWLKPATEDAGTYVSLVFDATRNDETGAHEIDLRWQDARTQLARAGAPAAALDAVGEVAVQPTGVGGRVGRAVVATASGIVIDRLLPSPPLREESTAGPVPNLMPLVRSLAHDVRYVLVEMDRAGADVTVAHSDAPGTAEEQTVEGDHDLLHKVPGGGWAALRYQYAVQDSWDHNAATVAEHLDKLVARENPEAVFVTGDTKAMHSLRSKASQRVLALVEEVPGGSRHAGVKEEVFERNLAQALEGVRTRRRDRVVEQFEQEIGRTRTLQGPSSTGGRGLAVEGLTAVVDALRRSQVQVLLLRDDPTSTLRLWTGSDPLCLGASAEEVRALGEPDPVEVAADAALVRAVAASDAEMELVAERPDAAQGIGALLRYADPSTPQ